MPHFLLGEVFTHRAPSPKEPSPLFSCVRGSCTPNQNPYVELLPPSFRHSLWEILFFFVLFCFHWGGHICVFPCLFYFSISSTSFLFLFLFLFFPQLSLSPSEQDWTPWFWRVPSKLGILWFCDFWAGIEVSSCRYLEGAAGTKVPARRTLGMRGIREADLFVWCWGCRAR